MINPLQLKCTEQASRIGLGDMARKVNELVKVVNDHLNKHREVAKKHDHISTRGEMINSDKKEASKTAVKTLVRKRVDIKTATKYCDVCKAEKGMIHLYEECIQEASKGECADVPCMHCPAHVATCHICHKPQEESSKEDGWLEKTVFKNIKAKSFFSKEEIDYIKANFVSKVKIKREIDRELELLRGTTACTFYDFADDLKESLGLEEL